MRKLYICALVVFCVLFGGCTSQKAENTIATLHKQLNTAKAQNAKLGAENEKLKAKVNHLTGEVKKLSDTPAARLLSIRKIVANSNLQKAHAALKELQSKYPRADETRTATKVVAKLSDQVKAKKREKARLERLKFRAISVTPTFTHNGLKFRTLKVSRTRRWVSDSYHYEYHYRDADRGTRFIVLRVNISSKASKDPNLFPVAVYKVSGKKLIHVADFEYAFRHWHDYGSYLGNYSDSGNSFAKSKTVRFTLAAQVSDDILKTPLLVVASNEQCVERTSRNLAPAVAYYGFSCKSLKQDLSLADVASGKYHVIKRYNF